MGMKKYLLMLAVAIAIALPCSADQYIFGFSGGADVSLVTNIGTFTTSQNEINQGIRNQGWWSPQAGNNNGNDNYIAGNVSDTNFYNDFFTFYIPLDRGAITSVVLSIPQYTTVTAPFTYSLFDVSTDAVTLNNKDNGPNSSIYNDLGSGVTYGSIAIPDDSSTPNPLLITLNASAVSAINGTRNGYFSIGGTISPTTVPEPTSLLLLSTALLAVPLGKRMFKRSA
jgi:hypothetical protein